MLRIRRAFGCARSDDFVNDINIQGAAMRNKTKARRRA